MKEKVALKIAAIIFPIAIIYGGSFYLLNFINSFVTVGYYVERGQLPPFEIFYQLAIVIYFIWFTALLFACAKDIKQKYTVRYWPFTIPAILLCVDIILIQVGFDVWTHPAAWHVVVPILSLIIMGLVRVGRPQLSERPLWESKY